MLTSVDPHGDPYLELLKAVLTRHVGATPYAELQPRSRGRRRLVDLAQGLLGRGGVALVRRVPEERVVRAAQHGGDPPPGALTMVGLRRLDDLEWCVRDVVERQVPGDLLEAGVWRGGVVIFLRALLRQLGENDRVVWGADTFRGLPPPDLDRFPDDAALAGHTGSYAAGLDEVEVNLDRFGLRDGVRLLPGPFAETLPDAPVERLAVLRLDADLQSSTAEVLAALYPRLAPGGWCIVDDYGSFPGCRRAVDEYRTEHGIDGELHWVDTTLVRWRHEGGP